MQVGKLKTLREVGAVRKITVTGAPGGGWTVTPVFSTATGEKSEPLARQRKGIRVVATLDAVTQFLFALGISEFYVLAKGNRSAAKGD